MAKYMDIKTRKRFVNPTAEQIENWFKHNRIDYKNLRGQFRICNPDGDSKFCMEISKEKSLVHDFRPNHQQYDGTFVRFVSKYKSISISEAIDDICGSNIIYESIENDCDDEDDDIEDEIDLPNGCYSIRDEKMFGSRMRSMVMDYLVKERCLSEYSIIKANIHYLGTSVIVPYYEYGMIVFWQMRHQLSKVFKFPPSSNKSAGDFLYGFDNVEPYSFVIVTESIFNTLSIGDDCVATGGASLKSGQVKLLKSLRPSKIILAPDNDSAGISSVQKDFLLLRKEKFDVYYCLPPIIDNRPDIDWNDLKKIGIDPREYILKNNLKLTMKDVFNGINGKNFII